MAKSLYASANGLAQKVKKMYLGIEGVARKVKKGYVGVNGLARLFFSGSAELVKSLKSVSNLSQVMWSHDAAHAGQYVFIGGGYTLNNLPNFIINAYNKELVQTVIDFQYSISYGEAGDTSAATTEHYAWINSTGTNSQNGTTTNLLDSDGTVSATGKFLMQLGSKGVGFDDRAIFTGSIPGGDSTQTRLIMENLSYSQGPSTRPFTDHACAKVNQVVVLLGSSALSGAYSTKVDSISKDGVYTPLSDLVQGTMGPTSATMGNKAVFAGGNGYVDGQLQNLKNVFCYDQDLTFNKLSDLPIAAKRMGYSEGTEDIAIFAGGNTSVTNKLSQVIYYDSEFIQHIADELTQPRELFSLAIHGNYVLISGGVSNADRLNNVELYEIA